MWHLLSDSLFGTKGLLYSLMTNQTDDSDRLGLGGLIQRRVMLESGLSILSASSLLIKKHSACQNTRP